MRKSAFYPLLILITALMSAGCNTNSSNKQKANEKQPADTLMTARQLVQKGEYLVTVFGGCPDCHAPKEMGPQGPVPVKSLWLSGYPSDRPVVKADPSSIKKGWIMIVFDLTSASGPWGVSFAANLTSDQTGIGNWTEENFIRALKEGKYKGIPNGRTLLPTMPWQNFTNAKVEDLRAIFAYLKSIPPVRNVVPEAIIATQQNNQVIK